MRMRDGHGMRFPCSLLHAIMATAMETTPETSDRCALCQRVMLSVLYYGADGESVGGHRICADCGPRSVVELVAPDELRRRLLERKAS
jgi:hypothetical protein